MQYRDPAIIHLIAPIFLEVLRLPAKTSKDMRLFQSQVLNCMCRELEKFLVFKKSQSAQRLADRRKLGDLSRFRWSDQTQKRKMGDLGRKTFHLEHTVPVAELARKLMALKKPRIKDIAKIIAQAEVTWITKKEDRKLTKLKAGHKRPNPKAVYREAEIVLCTD
jgi:hypothetical protein